MIGLWLVLSGAALFVMTDYGNEPGEAGTAPDIWPSALSVGIVPTPGKSTVVLFYEPTDVSVMPEVWTASDLKRIAANPASGKPLNDVG